MFGPPLALVPRAAGAHCRHNSSRRYESQPGCLRDGSGAHQRVDAGLAVAHHQRGAAAATEVGARGGEPVALFGLLDGQHAVESATLEAASSSTRGGVWAPSGWASLWECRRRLGPPFALLWAEEAQEPSLGGGQTEA